MSGLNPADEAFHELLSRVLPEDTVVPVEPRFVEEPRGNYCGTGKFVVLPRTTAEVATIVSACSNARVGLVPFGGGTGLVAGQVQPDGPEPVILSLERMREIRSLHPEENVIVVEAGTVLSNIHAAAKDAGRLFPLSLASEGTAQIGGLLATNAGGVNVLRYGNMRDLCLGLEVVLPDGSIWNGLRRLRKDNTGYDLRHLMIGSEGTLGVITAASLQMSSLPADCAAALLVVDGPAAAQQLLTLAQSHAGDTISAFELVDKLALDFVRRELPLVRQPFTPAPDWLVLIDVAVSSDSATAQLELILSEAFEQGLVKDGLISQSETQRAEFWALRESIPEANRIVGAVASHDISLPLGEIVNFLAGADADIHKIGPFRINCFGHLGDGNLHYNIFPPEDRQASEFADQRAAVVRCLLDRVHALGGSFSAEHGVGRLKVADLERYGDPAKLAAMRAIKTALDPGWIMNPGALLRQITESC